MKNKLLPLLVVLGGYSAYSQVGIGTLNPNPSAQLEVLATNRGILIPRVELTSSTDITTITNKNVESLLVFNTKTIADITPGYYYWYDGKWHRMAISDEISGNAGTASGAGVPGKEGEPGYPGKNISIYTDTTTGIVYVQNADGSWSSLNGENGIDGKNGVMGGNGAPGTPGASGIDGTIQMYIDYTTGIVYVRDPKDPKSWVPLNGAAGNNGKDGMSGGTGAPGTPGASGINADSTIYVDESTGIVYILTPGTDPLDPKNWIPLNGKNGNNGKDGIAGGTGAPGTPGASGASGINADSTIYIDESTGTVYILTPGTDPTDPKNWISINGKDGLDGKNGVMGGNGAPGTPGASGIDGTIQMYIDYTTGIVYVRDPKDPTKWVPLNGPAGNNGKDGMSGGDGAPGTPGASGINANSTIYVDNSTGIVYILTPGTDPLDPKNWIPLNGKNGNNGKDGIAGGTGAPGTPGASGASGINADSTIYIDESTGTVYILTPGTDPAIAGNWIPINTPVTKGTLTTEGVISINNGKNILFADAVIRVNGGTNGQVLTTDTTGNAVWSNPTGAAIKVRRVTASDALVPATDNIVIVDASAATGQLTFTLPATGLDASQIGKIFSVKRVDANSNATVKVVAAGGTIDDTETMMTIGETNSYQLILESVSPVKWQTVSKF